MFELEMRTKSPIPNVYTYVHTYALVSLPHLMSSPTPHILTHTSCPHSHLMFPPTPLTPHVLTHTSCPHSHLMSSPTPHALTHTSCPHPHLMSSPTPHVLTHTSCPHPHLMSSPTPHVLTHTSCPHPHLMPSPTPHILTHTSCPHSHLMSSPIPHALTHTSCPHPHLMSSLTPHILTHTSCPHSHLMSSHTPCVVTLGPLDFAGGIYTAVFSGTNKASLDIQTYNDTVTEGPESFFANILIPLSSALKLRAGDPDQATVDINDASSEYMVLVCAYVLCACRCCVFVLSQWL